MANDYAIRPALLKKGIANDDIGYDEGSGYVQVKGQNFLKPELNVQGTTYTSQANFDNAYNQFDKSQKTAAQQAMQQQAQPAPVQQVNPYANQFNQMISDIQNRLSAPQFDPYSTPQYLAAQARAQQGAQQGIRSAQEAMGAAGFGRSTALGNAAQREQNNATQYLMTQAVPQIQQQLQAQREAEIANQFSLLNPVLSMLNRNDSLAQQGRENARADAQLTGNYLPQDARDLINNILSMKQQAEGGNVSPEQMLNFRTQADEKRRQLATMGVDPNVVGYDSDYNQALQNVAKGTPTLQGQQFQYGKERDQVGDARYDQQFQYGQQQDAIKNDQWNQQFQYGQQQDSVENQLRQQQFQQQAQQFAASQGLDWARLSQAQQQFVSDQAMKQQQLSADQAYRQQQLSAENNPNSLDNQYKQAQIDSMKAKTPEASGIDEYDLLQVEALANQAGVTPQKAEPEQIKSFVADLKGKYGWTLDEAKSVESYLNSKKQAYIEQQAAAKAAEKPKPFGYRPFGG